MNASRVLQLILLFYNLAVKHADKATGGSAGNGAYINLMDGTLFIETGYAAGKELSAEYINGTVTINLTDREDG